MSCFVNVAAILRQAFRWFRTHCVTGIPPYTLCVIAIGVGFALATTKEVLCIVSSWDDSVMVDGA